MKKQIIALLLCFGLFSCSSDETTSTTSDSSSETTTSPTEVTLTVLDSDNNTKSDYIVMMFDEPVDPDNDNNLPEILMQETSDSQGEVVFELDDFISENGEGTYYFEAFSEIQNGFSFESVTHPDFYIEEGKSITSSIIVE